MLSAVIVDQISLYWHFVSRGLRSFRAYLDEVPRLYKRDKIQLSKSMDQVPYFPAREGQALPPPLRDFWPFKTL